jgi:hypothetical protein
MVARQGQVPEKAEAFRCKPVAQTFKCCTADSRWKFILAAALKMRKISWPEKEDLFTGIWRNLILVILPEGNHENPRTLIGHCAHSHLKKSCTGHSTWGKSRESQGYTWTLCSFPFEEILYWSFYLRKITTIPGPYLETVLTPIWRNIVLVILPEENHEIPRAIHGHCAHSHLKKSCTGHSTWGKSRESQGYTWTMCSLPFEEILYWSFYLRKITRIPGPYMDTVLTPIWRNLVLVILPEENHENPRAIHGHCAHPHLMKSYTDNCTWGKSRESQGPACTLCSHPFEEILYL